MPPFEVGEAVVCVDAADIPPMWHPLECGHQYVIRTVESSNISKDNTKGNVHKNSAWNVRLWGISNPTCGKAASLFGMTCEPGLENVELAYAASRFEKINSISEEQVTESRIERVA
jgi:hypothetical protein